LTCSATLCRRTRGLRGRPKHTPTDEKRRLVIGLLAFGKTQEEIAAALSITPPTLRRNYLRQLKQAAAARAKVDAFVLARLLEQVDAGSVSAMKEYRHLRERQEIAEAADRVAARGKAEPAKGKKELRMESAGQVTGKYAPPPPPRVVN